MIGAVEQLEKLEHAVNKTTYGERREAAKERQPNGYIYTSWLALTSPNQCYKARPDLAHNRQVEYLFSKIDHCYLLETMNVFCSPKIST